MRDVKPGDVLRLKYLTHTEQDGVTEKGYRPGDQGRLKQDKKVFVVLLLGVEPMLINEEFNRDATLDPDKALSELGWVMKH